MFVEILSTGKLTLFYSKDLKETPYAILIFKHGFDILASHSIFLFFITYFFVFLNLLLGINRGNDV